MSTKWIATSVVALVFVLGFGAATKLTRTERPPHTSRAPEVRSTVVNRTGTQMRTAELRGGIGIELEQQSPEQVARLDQQRTNQ